MKSTRRLALTYFFIVAGALCSATSQEPAEKWFDPVTVSREVRRGTDCEIVADQRIFAVMAFINAFGFDDEVKGVEMTNIRNRVRERLSVNLAVDPVAVERWRELYRTYNRTSADYIEWAITLTSRYPFRRVGPDSVCFKQDTPKILATFPEELNHFWKLARMDEVWEEVLPLYIEEIERYDLPRMSRDLERVWQCLRMPRKEGRIMVNVANPMDRHYNACSIPCGQWFDCSGFARPMRETALPQ